MNNKKLLVPRGYKVEQCSETVDITVAGQLLSGKKQRKYSSAYRNEWQAELVRHIWICPYCNAHIPAYPEFFWEKPTYGKIDRSTIAEWAVPQLCLFKEYNKKLQINKPIQDGIFICPKCGNKSKRDSDCYEIAVNKSGNSLEITTEINDLSKIFTLNWIGESRFTIGFPIYETVVFNFRNGHTFLKLHNGSGTDYTVSDITCNPSIWNNGQLYEILVRTATASRALKKSFAEIYGCKLPFADEELTLEKYILMCRFVRFPKSFYHAVPFAYGPCSNDRTFKSVAKNLHTSEMLPATYNNSSLPKAKSVKKVFFENPGLFFYLRECEKLWDTLEDINLFREIITCANSYEILSKFHLFPGVIFYYQDFARYKGARALVDRLKDELYGTNIDAVMYAGLNDCARKQERKNWKKCKKSSSFPDYFDEDENCCYKMLPEPFNYSIPFATYDHQISPCTIDGFSFSWLSNSAEYYETGCTLHNCLTSWDSFSNPVVVVKQHGVAVAAIEVSISNHYVVQFMETHNRHVDMESKLGKAYQKWKKRYSISERQLEMDDLLPF